MALQALGDRDSAEEVAQETLVRTLQALRDKRRKAPEHLGAFVRGVARHVISDMWAARRCAQPLEALPGGECRAAREDPLCALVTQEEREHVRRALQRLLPSDRYILHLSFFEGLTPSEIAHRVGEPASRIRKRKSRALRRLREAFRVEAETPQKGSRSSHQIRTHRALHGADSPETTLEARPGQ
jgi:RNA polymerase sigma-70 factor (ECF subfamily)